MAIIVCIAAPLLANFKFMDVAACLHWLCQILVSSDQFAQVMIVGLFYVVGLTSACPSADETISSYVWRAQLRGAWCARVMVPVIDDLFVLLGEEPGHCRRNIETACLGLPPTT